MGRLRTTVTGSVLCGAAALGIAAPPFAETTSAELAKDRNPVVRTTEGVLGYIIIHAKGCDLVDEKQSEVPYATFMRGADGETVVRQGEVRDRQLAATLGRFVRRHDTAGAVSVWDEAPHPDGIPRAQIWIALPHGAEATNAEVQAQLSLILSSQLPDDIKPCNKLNS